jgi:GLPGLI family protein
MHSIINGPGPIAAASVEEPIVWGTIDYKVVSVFEQSKVVTPSATAESIFRVSFDKEHIRGDQINQNPNNFFILDRNKKQIAHYIDMFGTIYQLTDAERKAPAVEIKQTEDSKVILGFKCSRIIVVRPEGEFEAWITKDIDLKYPSYMPGCALEYAVPANYGKRLYTATTIKTTAVVQNLFEVPEKCEKITTAELKSRLTSGHTKN